MNYEAERELMDSANKLSEAHSTLTKVDSGVRVATEQFAAAWDGLQKALKLIKEESTDNAILWPEGGEIINPEFPEDEVEVSIRRVTSLVWEVEGDVDIDALPRRLYSKGSECYPLAMAALQAGHQHGTASWMAKDYAKTQFGFGVIKDTLIHVRSDGISYVDIRDVR